ncbi:hypothetical protein EQP49_13355 [Yersinia sp. 2105 StPb PI]|nr:hypothetical protein EQP49_13355 [Yersinia sp. 2105 StPb PI]
MSSWIRRLKPLALQLFFTCQHYWPPLSGRRCAMYDNSPREVEDLIDHCRALIYALITLESQEVKEILSFVLQQQIDLLHRIYHQDLNEPLEAAA